jgi:hypothetical protein
MARSNCVIEVEFDFKKIEDQLDSIRIIKEALEYYSDDSNYHRNGNGMFPVVTDNGTTADFAVDEFKKIFDELVKDGSF